MMDLDRMPALTRAEADAMDSYVRALEQLARINPARQDETYRALRAAQALVTQATALRDALTVMFQRGQTEFHSATLVRALRILEAETQIERLRLS
jgi:hypothetical protein